MWLLRANRGKDTREDKRLLEAKAATTEALRQAFLAGAAVAGASAHPVRLLQYATEAPAIGLMMVVDMAELVLDWELTGVVKERINRLVLDNKVVLFFFKPYCPICTKVNTAAIRPG